MRFTKPTKTEWIVIGVILAALVALLLPSTQGVWDGQFRLTIEVHEHEPIDRQSLLFATCWFEPEADRALQTPGVYECGFRPLELSDDGQAIMDVPASGRCDAWGTCRTYNHPKFLVVEYRLAAEGNEELARKRFPIPMGRGPRSMSIDLP